jgi:hypothetical protein
MPIGVYVRTPEFREVRKEQIRNRGGFSAEHLAHLRAARHNRTDVPWNKGQKTGPRTAETRAKISTAARNGPTSAYCTWRSMRQRCFNANMKAYPYYGGRGITICPRWLDSFENFLADMGERPPGTSLDRFPNNSGNYEPGNCRWATSKEQAQNRRKRVR